MKKYQSGMNCEISVITSSGCGHEHNLSTDQSLSIPGEEIHAVIAVSIASLSACVICESEIPKTYFSRTNDLHSASDDRHF